MRGLSFTDGNLVVLKFVYLLQNESYIHGACFKYRDKQQSLLPTYKYYQFTNISIDATSSLSILSPYARLCERLSYPDKSVIVIEIGEMHMQSIATLKGSNTAKYE